MLAIVDASVGVKTGIDWECCGSRKCGGFKEGNFDTKKEGDDKVLRLKNRMGSFYPPSSVLVDEGWVRTQDVRNLRNGCGEIFKLAVVKSR